MRLVILNTKTVEYCLLPTSFRRIRAPDKPDSTITFEIIIKKKTIPTAPKISGPNNLAKIIFVINPTKTYPILPDKDHIKLSRIDL